MHIKKLAISAVAAALCFWAAGPQGASALTGGPDAFGYVFTDSTEVGGPGFSFVDISGTGTQSTVSFCDDCSQFGVPIGFTFNLYGVDFTSVLISSNGTVNFNGVGTGFSNVGIPGPLASSGPAVAPFWDDHNPGCSAAGNVYFETQGTAPNRRFIVQWQTVNRFGCGGASTFETILFEGTGQILFQYGDTNGNGNGATVGIQQSGSVGLQYSFNSGIITNGLAILFSIDVLQIIQSQIDHYQCYGEKESTKLDPEPVVSLEDQFAAADVVEVKKRPKFFCNPVSKNGEPIVNPLAHLACYKIKSNAERVKRGLAIENQFTEEQILIVEKPKYLCVPSLKEVIDLADAEQAIDDDDDDDDDDD